MNKIIFEYVIRRVAWYVTLLFFIPSLLIGESPFEKRLLWVVRDAMSSTESIDELIEFADENKFNHLLVQVRGRGDALYESNLVPRSIRLKDADFDPLEYIISKAKPLDIKIHAWLNMYYLWSASSMPNQQNHLLYTNPDWLDNDSQKNVNVEQVLIDIKNKSYNDEGLFLAPTHPEVSRYLIDVVEEVVQNYNIDGIHLDYVRFYNENYGLNPVGLSFYKKYRGESNVPFLSTQIIQDPIWGSFRRNSVTKLVKGISNVIKANRDNCILSAAVKPNLYSARNDFGQEWDVWLLAGYLDWVIPMNYLPELDIFSTNINVMEDNLPKKHRSKIIMGLATYNQDPNQVNEKIQFTKDSGFNGICLFSYNVFRDTTGYFDRIKKHLVP
ncbi:MAG: family 10 glycosylhydrolase [Candidatus Marinimicrobia bacterium]|jgi:uncharacterized lipoprotein YddW (UPF0748 family)|nr:family 10 glycosylhydrolase [Candidatus Neomarinimicrobiota bacterium]MBT3936246.1 family 10 glycosylhydrolase [Candidatus Neomarinimicrobiota bacterium]MBT3961793.1 family 10 glycosylhydrolase [Candidatus Neomarinimicrobiota bacterium]MBT4383966.1 family 10 glycosylhydrolase [Candidatus Neomarinimicrobiota bacterium]MBT4635051.1 family 10 glycosylhydrolase [Candidatus Neomarinimicrobiota bacterium]